MSRGRFVELPSEVSLTLTEVKVLLGALDRAEEIASAQPESAVLITAAIRLLTMKLWPELGELLDDEE